MHSCNAQSKKEMECKEQKPKSPCIFHAAIVKQIPKRIVDSDKRRGNEKCMKAKKVMDLDETEACT